MANGGWGITVTGGETMENVVHDNANGIQVSGGTAVGNRVYHNTGVGVQIVDTPSSPATRSTPTHRACKA